MSQQKKKDIVPVYASIDFGSNNVRMNLYGVDVQGRLTRIHIDEQTTFECKLAENMTAIDPVIQRPNMTLAINAASAFNIILTTYNIKPENICAVATAALREVQDTEQGREDISQLITAFGQRPLTVITGEEEAILVGEAVKLACPKGWGNHRGKKSTAAFAALGGGSVELGEITSEGVIIKPMALLAGVHTLKKLSDDNIPRAGRIFKKMLRDNYRHSRHDVLYVIGGNWRGLGRVICERRLPVMLKGEKHIHHKLVSMARRKPKYFESYGQKIAKRAKDMPMAVAILRRVAQHFDAKKVIFLDTTIRDAMAQQMFARDYDQPIAPGLARIISPCAKSGLN